jgi:hypothetical protein
MNFRNVILIVSFNYANCLVNIPFYQQYYQPFFKNLVFYCSSHHENLNAQYIDFNDSEIKKYNVHYIDYGKGGATTQKIFVHFYSNYKELINEASGLFYTSDDNILNVHLLKDLNIENIIYPWENLYNLCHFKNDKWTWWFTPNGWDAIHSLEKDLEYKKFNITKYAKQIADFFYLPKKYLTPYLFELFHLFSKHQVWLEIAIPTIIFNIQPNRLEYSNFKFKWIPIEKQEIPFDEQNLKKYFMDENYLTLHPVKLYKSPQIKELLFKIK